MKPPKTYKSYIPLTLLFLSSALYSTHAADISWVATENSTWDTPENWSSGTVPTADDIAVFTGSSRSTIATDNTTIAGLNLNLTGTQPFYIDKQKELFVTGPITGTGGIELQGYTDSSIGNSGRIEIRSNNNTFEGDILCTAGCIRMNLFGNNTDIPLNSWLGTGNIILNGGVFSFKPNGVAVNDAGLPQDKSSPSIALQNKVKVTKKGGELEFNVGSGGTYWGRLLGDVDLAGKLLVLSSGGGGAYGNMLAGTITLDQSEACTPHIQIGTKHNGADWIAGPIIDGEGNANNPLTLSTIGKGVNFTAFGSTYVGGTIIEKSGGNAIVVHPFATLGTGGLTIRRGGIITLKNLSPLGTDCNLKADQMIHVDEGGIIEFGSTDTTVKANLTSGSPIVTFSGAYSTLNLFVGQTITAGASLPEGTIVVSIESDTQATLSQPATKTAENTTLTLKANTPVNIASRITSDSAGVYGISGEHDYDIDQKELGNRDMFIGSRAGGTFKGHISPCADNTYRLGGGMGFAFNESTYVSDMILNLPVENTLTGDNALVVGPGWHADGGANYGQLNIANDNDYTGGTIVNSGSSLWLSKNAGNPFGSGHVHVLSGAFFGASGYTAAFYNGTNNVENFSMYPGSTFVLNEGRVNEDNPEGRWKDDKPLRLVDVNLHGYTQTDSRHIENIGPLQFSENVKISVHGSETRAYLHLVADSFERQAHGTLSIGDNVAGAERFKIKATHPPQLTNGMLPPYYISNKTGQFLTYTTNGLETLVGYTDYTTAGVTNVAKITDNPTIDDDIELFALYMSSGAEGSGKIKLQSGGVTIVNKVDIYPILDFSENEEAIVNINPWKEVTFRNGIISTNTLILTNGGKLKLYKEANLSGNVVVNYGEFIVNQSSAAADVVDCHITLNNSGKMDLDVDAWIQSLSGPGQVTGKKANVKLACNPGGTELPGKLRTTDLYLGDNCTTRFRIGKISDQIEVKGDFTLNGTLHFEKARDFVAGLYPIVTYSGDFTKNPISITSDPSLFVRLNTDEAGVIYADCQERPVASTLIIR